MEDANVGRPGGNGMSLKDEKEYKMIEEGIKVEEEKRRWVAAYPWVKR